MMTFGMTFDVTDFRDAPFTSFHRATTLPRLAKLIYGLTQSNQPTAVSRQHAIALAITHLAGLQDELKALETAGRH